jgi:hypothetical protein
LAALSPVGVADAQDVPSADTAIQRLFTDMFNCGGSGGHTCPTGTAVGKINADSISLDDRVYDMEKMPFGSCLQTTGAQASHRIDLTSIAPALDLTLFLQCREEFQVVNGAPVPNGGSGGAGLAVGSTTAMEPDGGTLQVGSAYSLWVNAAPTGTIGFVANVTNADTNKSVDFLGAATLNNRVSAYRVKGTPATKAFELVCAGGCSSANAGIGGLDCGFRLNSDGSHIWAEGKYAPMGDCTTATPFGTCYDATSFAVVNTTPDPCAALKAGFTMAQFTSADLANQASAVDAAFTIPKTITLANAP